MPSEQQATDMDQLFWDLLWEEEQDDALFAITSDIFEKAQLSEAAHSLWRQRVLPSLLRESVRIDWRYRREVGIENYNRLAASNQKEAATTDWRNCIPAGASRGAHERSLAAWFVKNQARHKLYLDKASVAEDSRKAYCSDIENTDNNTEKTTMIPPTYEEKKGGKIGEGEAEAKAPVVIYRDELIKLAEKRSQGENKIHVRERTRRQLRRRKEDIEAGESLPAPLYGKNHILGDIYIVSTGEGKSTKTWSFEVRDVERD